MKKVLSIVLCLVMMLSVFAVVPLTVYAEDKATVTIYGLDGVTVDDQKEFNVGDEFTVYTYLNCSKIYNGYINSLKGEQGFTPSILEEIDEKNVKTTGTTFKYVDQVFPVTKEKTTANAGISGSIPYNASTPYLGEDAYHFNKYDSLLIVTRYRVNAPGNASITNTMRTLAYLDGGGDYEDFTRIIYQGEIKNTNFIFCGSFSPPNKTLEYLKTKFPQDAYWNHLANDTHRYVNHNDQGTCNNPDKWTETPCYTHVADATSGHYDCNSFHGAIQCKGFARKLGFDVYGSDEYTWGRGTLENCKPGDILTYYGYDATSAEDGHTCMIIGVNGTTITIGECNYKGNCRINWGRTINYRTANFTGYTLYSAPYQLPASSTADGYRLTDNTTNISVDTTDNSTLSVKTEVDDVPESSSGKTVTAYDISLMKDNEPIQPSAKVKVRIPSSNPKAKVFHWLNGVLTDMKAVFVDGFLEFFTDHFSVYIVSEAYLLGDTDSDEELTSIDATYILRYTASIDVHIDEATLIHGDVDGNEELDVVDATYIQRYLAEFQTPYKIGEPII